MTGRADEKRAAKMTIVGGQPETSNARDLPPVPVGIEELLAMAAVDKRFAKSLEQDRERGWDRRGRMPRSGSY